MAKRPRLATALRLTFAAFKRHNASRFGAALAFYIIFSIAPIVLIAIALAGSLLGREEAERAILDRIGGSFGAAPSAAIAAMIKDASAGDVGWFATAVGLMTLYFGVSGVYRQVADALRTIWHEQPPSNTGPIDAVRKRIFSILLVMAAGVILFISVAADAVIAFTGKYAASRLVGGETLWHLMQLLVSTIALTFLFAIVFRYMVKDRVSWRDVRLGSAVTAILFVLGKFALGLYLGKAAVGSAFGAAGSMVVVLLWSYWSAQIFFFGLEFTHVYAQERA
jgi:membrane protein